MQTLIQTEGEQHREMARAPTPQNAATSHRVKAVQHVNCLHMIMMMHVTKTNFFTPACRDHYQREQRAQARSSLQFHYQGRRLYSWWAL